MATAIGTWSFSKFALHVGKDTLTSGGNCLDAVENSIASTEEDFSYGVCHIGRGGFPNNRGEVECDAAMMYGHTLDFGAVAALKGVTTPIRVARKLLETPSTCMLVGAGAEDFAKQHGFHIHHSSSMMPQKDKDVFMKDIADKPGSKKGHDTLAVIFLDSSRHIAAGVTTSGLGYKLPGRVGDSPLVGAGLYADDSVGAACATGDGDHILKFCPSFHVVSLMRQGMEPDQACKQVIREILQRAHRESGTFSVSLIAMNIKGEVGAASTITDWIDLRTGEKYPGFPYSVWKEGDEDVALKLVSRENYQIIPSTHAFTF